MTATHNRFGYPRRRVTGKSPRAQTYRVLVLLECGHDWSYTVSARRLNDPRAHPLTVACGRCPADPSKAEHRPTHATATL